MIAPDLDVELQEIQTKYNKIKNIELNKRKLIFFWCRKIFIQIVRLKWRCFRHLKFFSGLQRTVSLSRRLKWLRVTLNLVPKSKRFQISRTWWTRILAHTKMPTLTDTDLLLIHDFVDLTKDSKNLPALGAK